MKKQINATGVNGTFTGWVEVKLYNSRVDTHRIYGIANDKKISSEVAVDEKELIEIIEQTEMLVTKALCELANQPPKESIESQLKARGFI